MTPRTPVLAAINNFQDHWVSMLALIAFRDAIRDYRSQVCSWHGPHHT
jgi:hypothetical protein